MDIFTAAEKLMGMDDDAWARHANPWSGYTRIAAAAPIFLAIWSAHWIGWWSLVPIGMVVTWVFINPRLWPAPTLVDTWIGKGVLGERAWINRKTVAVPDHHAVFANLTIALSAAFVLMAIYGFVVADFWAAFGGWFGAVLAKCWFIDRMVWLWADMKDAHPVYKSWANADWSARFPT
ncbi:MAG: DUF6653 family protein [Pseudomonadota bacterium]